MKNKIQEYLLQLNHPELDQKFILKDTSVKALEDNKINLSIQLNFPFKSQTILYENIIKDGIKKITDLDITFNWSLKILTRQAQKGINPIKEIKNRYCYCIR